MSQQTTSNILMIRPANFGFNEQTAANNSFQSKDESLTAQQIKENAIAEFDSFVQKMRNEGINVIVVEDTVEPIKPDAVFPNNWISFHENGSVLTYPMYAPLRRKERREDVLEMLKNDFQVFGTYKFEEFEKEDIFLEGTGSMILDRVNKIVYACLSPRTDSELLNAFCDLMQYESAVFTSVDGNGEDIYHTNVMMAVGEDFVVICLDTIRDEDEKKKVLSFFEKTKKEVIEISYEQMLSFAGNMLQVRNTSGDTYLIMSSQAFESLNKNQIEKIQQKTKILHSSIKTIETFGGGSARCMMAEVFLPKKNTNEEE